MRIFPPIPFNLIMCFSPRSPSSCFRDTRKSLLNYIELPGSELVVTRFIFTPTLAEKQGIKLQGKGLLCFIFSQDRFLLAL